MEVLKNVFFTFCIIIVICEILKKIIPKGEISKYANVIISIFIILCLINTVKKISNMDIKIFDDTYKNQSYQISKDKLWENAINSSEQNYKKIIENYLSENGIGGVDVDVNLSLKGEQIEIENINLYGENAYHTKNIIAGHFNIPLNKITVDKGK